MEQWNRPLKRLKNAPFQSFLTYFEGPKAVVLIYSWVRSSPRSHGVLGTLLNVRSRIKWNFLVRYENRTSHDNFKPNTKIFRRTAFK